MSSKDAPDTARLSPADAADLATRVIEHAETWLTRDDRIAPIIVLGGPPDLEQETLRRDDEQRREQAQADLIRDGGPLAAALVAHDLDSAPLLTLLNHTNPGHCIRGANAAEAVWPQVKVSLQVAVIRLRKVNSNASPSTLTAENGAATAEQTEVADVAAGARPSSVPRQVSPARSHSDTAPPDVTPPAKPTGGKRVDEAATDPELADATGYVARPADSSSYVPMAAIRANYCKDIGLTTIKEITKVLEDFPTNKVRWTRPPSKKSGAPHPQRRSVHLVDWETYVDRLKHPRAAADEVGFQDLSPAEIEARKASVRRNRKVRK